MIRFIALRWTEQCAIRLGTIIPSRANPFLVVLWEIRSGP